MTLDPLHDVLDRLGCSRATLGCQPPLRARCYSIHGIGMHCAAPADCADQQFAYIEQYLADDMLSAPAAPPLGWRRFVCLADAKLYVDLARALAGLSPSASHQVFPGCYRPGFTTADAEVFLPPRAASGRVMLEEPLIVAAPQSVALVFETMHAGAKRYMLRAMRDTLIRRMEDAGAASIHAAAVALHNTGLLLPGSKGNGKTSLMCHLLAGRPGYFLANDRVLITPDNTLCAVPLPVRMSRPTMMAHRSLADISTGRVRPLRLSLPADPDLHTGKVELTPRELVAMFGAGLAGHAPAALIAAPQFDPALEDRCRVEQLAPGPAARILHECCFTPHDECWQETWLTRRQRTCDQLADGAARLIDAMCRTVPAIRVRFGPAVPSPAVREAVLSCLN